MAARFVRGNAVRIEADITDSASGPVAATPIVITIFDPRGNAVVTEAAMTASAVTGTYFYNRQTVVTDLIGVWKVVVAATVGTPIGRQLGSFELFSAT